ncbi:growth associated protein 43 [Rhinolophus ferrumequinum]|uniref:Growth associated protein 43 n=1 Tax=Rhinolophus ferrumequinum TaxID=59479 RepID=A0A7J8AEC8_RHIFE|nr:growth associated protein 43 [Rhinolophus ferrumequinum]
MLCCMRRTKQFKKKKKQERSQVKQCGLNIFCFLVLLWRVFGNDDPIIWGNSCTVSKFLIWCVWPCGSPLSSLSLSVPSVCAMFRSSEESKISSEFKTIFLFFLFNVME